MTKFSINPETSVYPDSNPAYQNIDITVVPEPLSLVMMGLGGLVLRRGYCLIL